MINAFLHAFIALFVAFGVPGIRPSGDHAPLSTYFPFNPLGVSRPALGALVWFDGCRCEQVLAEAKVP
jgi:hypothetical protein